MSEHDNIELACDLINAWNARDLPRYRTLLSADCVVEGRTEVTDVAANEHTAVVSWRARGTVRLWHYWDDDERSRPRPIEAWTTTAATAVTPHFSR